jgi:hypothetical protein
VDERHVGFPFPVGINERHRRRHRLWRLVIPPLNNLNRPALQPRVAEFLQYGSLAFLS